MSSISSFIIKRYLLAIIICTIILALSPPENDNANQDNSPAPYLKQNGDVLQLMVNDKPYLVLGGELHNSSSTSREYMKTIWPRLKAMNLNTILAVVEWALIEPKEGEFDFTIVDELIEDARKHDIKLAVLWFGAWKNGQSHYMPGWVKKDYKRFPRVKTSNGKSLEILSTLAEETRKSDSRAFAAVMRHIKEVDSEDRTVIMIQLQNEVGILGATRDYSDLGNAAFKSDVSKKLLDNLIKNKETLLPELKAQWAANKYSTNGNWEEVFGKSNLTDELFMAWNYSNYINDQAISGKAEYDIPMFVNAWIVQPEDLKPGDYPSGGPQAHVLDVWRVGGTDIDLFCPDIYLPNFDDICKLYTQSGNTLFIPESRAGEAGVGQLFYAISGYNAIGYSPFGIESRVSDLENDPIPKAYALLGEMAPVILEAQQNKSIAGVLLKKENRPDSTISFGGYNLNFELIKRRRSDFVPSDGYCMIINAGPDEFILAGKNVQVSFTSEKPGPSIVAIESLYEGSYKAGKWIPRRKLNGDAIMVDYDLAKRADLNQTGTGIKFTGEDREIQRVKLYRYE